jgi:hypothetical protein
LPPATEYAAVAAIGAVVGVVETLLFTRGQPFTRIIHWRAVWVYVVASAVVPLLLVWLEGLAGILASSSQSVWQGAAALGAGRATISTVGAKPGQTFSVGLGSAYSHILRYIQGTIWDRMAGATARDARRLAPRVTFDDCLAALPMACGLYARDTVTEADKVGCVTMAKGLQGDSSLDDRVRVVLVLVHLIGVFELATVEAAILTIEAASPPTS